FVVVVVVDGEVVGGEAVDAVVEVVVLTPASPRCTAVPEPAEQAPATAHENATPIMRFRARRRALIIEPLSDETGSNSRNHRPIRDTAAGGSPFVTVGWQRLAEVAPFLVGGVA